MNLRQLFESHHKATASFCFGRFNPPHQGHAEVWSAVKHAGHKWYIGTNPSTIGPNDPLTFDVKTAWMTAIDPEIKGHILGETSVVTLAAKIYADVGEGATIAYVTDATDWAWAGKLLMDYNGKESNHGYYKFAKIIHVPSPRVSSATALRTAARAGDMAAFYAAAGTDPDLRVNGKHYFDTVVAAVGEHPEKVKRAKKEKATAEDAAGVGTITKQNTTVDVNKNTPAKNLRAFNLIKETNARIRAMRAKEFIAEEATAFSVDVQNALPNVRIHPDLDNSSPYKAYRYGIAMAGAPNNQGDPLAGIGQKMITVGYTDADDAIIASADKFMSSKSKPITSKGSQELKDTNKTSPVAKVKRNKYGV